jgi:GNAT superfamily N-acetyltransferase
MSLRRRATIEPGSVSDYRIFGPMHYRHRDGLGFVDKVFLLKESPRGDPLGILVFAHAPLELAQRNRCTAGRFIRNPRRLNRELRILRRLVMHPDVRGCGLGHWFVENTLPQVGVRFVECLAAMGAVNPVFERAGMDRIGRCPLPRGRMAMLQRLRQWNIDPFADDFPRRISRFPRVRKLVEKTIQDWVTTTQGPKKYRIEGRPVAVLAQTFRQIIGEPPLYYLWDKKRVYPRKKGFLGEGDPADPAGPPRAETGADLETSRTSRAAPRHSPGNSPGAKRVGARRKSARRSAG